MQSRKQTSSPYFMVFCLLLFGLSIGAFDRFASWEEQDKSSAEIPSEFPALVDVQRIIQEHSLDGQEPAVESQKFTLDDKIVAVADSVSEMLVDETTTVLATEAPKPIVPEKIENALLDTFVEVESIFVVPQQEVSLISLSSEEEVVVEEVESPEEFIEEDAPEPEPLEPRTVSIPKVPSTQKMRPTTTRRDPTLPGAMNMKRIVLTARAQANGGDSNDEPAPMALGQSEGTPVDLQPEFWPVSPQLQRQLKQLATIPSLTEWAGGLQAALNDLHAIRAVGSVESVHALAALRDFHEEGNRLVVDLSAVEVLNLMRKTLAGLDTRLEIWHAIQTIVSNQQVSIETTDGPNEQIAAAMEGIEERLVGSEEAENWRIYLNLHGLRQYINSDSGVDVVARGKDAQRVLLRMHARTLTPEQKSLLQEEAFTSLEFGLRQWCVEPVDYPKLMRDIELFESSRYNYRAVPVANTFQVIRWSLDDNVAGLGAMLEERYRAGNIRIRLSEGFINRLIPAETHKSDQIEEKVLGAVVEGTSDTTSRLKVQLLEDDGRWVIGLNAQGEIESNTTSSKGGAVFDNEASASFQANKKIMISPSGIEFGETLADVQSESKLINFETEYDNSLFGGIARNMAKSQYKDKEKSAAEAMDLRIRQQATDTLDDKVTGQMSKIEATYNSRWLEPMRDLNLRPVATQLHTVDNNLAIDYRLAGVHQLAAHGYRPELPKDSLVGIQIHESALNNLLHNLDLDGKSGKLVDVMSRIADQLGVEEFEAPVDVPETVMVRFMERESVRIRFYKGKVQLMIQMRQLQNKRLGWKNFAILAEYAPSSDAISGTLQRQGVIQILGRGLRLGDRIALQTIFNKVLPSTKTLTLLSESITGHPNMQTARVEQFEIEQGWLTFAVTEAKPAIANVEEEESTDR